MGGAHGEPQHVKEVHTEERRAATSLNGGVTALVQQVSRPGSSWSNKAMDGGASRSCCWHKQIEVVLRPTIERGAFIWT
ncbi:hypothetical protein VIGAN_08284800 [Vigna angularis var. angularis]|uniref:Uncharacterized protein n=1 Tax=Vigna angularis var. angularis TaxID=157739 RepID=A0A0S3ST22_PHAAN|nr:hypothetical protein VIGAN_08284800 [Vigna angularis var. angularis]